VSFDPLLAIFKEQAEEQRQLAAAPPVACPFDGEPLEEARGVLHCPWGDYEYPRDGKPIG
jgi:hypothetical protein